MKKILTILLMTLLLVSACSKKDDIQPPIQTPDSPCYTQVNNNDVIIFHTYKADSYALGDGKYDALGCGYDITGPYANWPGDGAPVIDIEKLVNDYSDYITIDYTEEEFYRAYYGENPVDYLFQLSEGQKLTAGEPLFKGTIFSTCGRGTTPNGAFYDSYVCGGYDYINIKKSLSIDAPESILKNYLTQSFLDYVNNSSPRDLVSMFGTHILMKIRVGGRLNLIYQSKTINTDRREAAMIGLKVYVDGFSGILNINEEEADLSKYCKNYSDCHSYSRSGGNASLPSFGDLTAWINSITTERCVLVDYWGDDALIPIYELIANPVRKAEIKAYIDNYLIENKAYLSE